MKGVAVCCILNTVAQECWVTTNIYHGFAQFPEELVYNALPLCIF